MKKCLKNSMVASKHYSYLKKIINDLNKDNINGAFIECGVWKGGMVMWMLYLQKQYSMNRDFFLYDTFEGMTEPTNIKDGKKEKKLWAKRQNNWCKATINLVKENINKIDYDKSKIHYIVGDVLKTLNIPQNIPDKIAILRLDTDWYDSTKKELDVLFPKVVKDGVVIIDDYYAWQGSRTATDEFIKKNKSKIKILEKTNPLFSFKKT